MARSPSMKPLAQLAPVLLAMITVVGGCYTAPGKSYVEVEPQIVPLEPSMARVFAFAGGEAGGRLRVDGRHVGDFGYPWVFLFVDLQPGEHEFEGYVGGLIGKDRVTLDVEAGETHYIEVLFTDRMMLRMVDPEYGASTIRRCRYVGDGALLKGGA